MTRWVEKSLNLNLGTKLAELKFDQNFWVKMTKFFLLRAPREKKRIILA